MPKEDKMLEELKRIRELLEPKPAPPPPKGLWNEFMDFLSKYKVMGLAVAFIIGLYLGALVQALVTGLVMPPIPPTQLDSQGNPIDPNYVGQLFGVGEFMAALITFIIVAFVIFIMVKVSRRWGIE